MTDKVLGLKNKLAILKKTPLYAKAAAGEGLLCEVINQIESIAEDATHQRLALESQLILVDDLLSRVEHLEAK